MVLMIFFYELAAYIVFILMLPFIPFIWVFSPKRRANLVQRLGFNSGLSPDRAFRKRIWVHALSVGEVKSALPLVIGLKNHFNDLEIIFTASTKTGYDMASSIFMGDNPGIVAQLGYFPFDIGFCVTRILNRISPDMVILVETDLWPGFLWKMKRNNIPVVLVNARLSNRSLKRCLMLPGLCRMFYSGLSAVLTQGEHDRRRFRRLGLDESKVVAAGNIKFDQPAIIVEKDEIEQIAGDFGIDLNTDFVFVAGSTHEGEEKILAQVFREMISDNGNFIMILAPRDPARCSLIRADFENLGIKARLMSQTPANYGQRSNVILVDSMGVLAKIYGLCNAAFTGGSLVNRGGHNPLEPAALAKPVFFGPDMSDFAEIRELLVNNGGAKTIKSGCQLAKELKFLVRSSRTQHEMGLRNFKVFSENSGAVQRIVNYIKPMINTAKLS
jgi:3-deoxy-D-manno-octulosonic-acid transferase